MAAIEFDWTPQELKGVRDEIDGNAHPQNRAPKEKSDAEVVREWMLDSVEEFMLGRDIHRGQAEATATARENRKEKRLK